MQPPNMYRVSSGLYIVRTQAGFKRALKRYLGEGYPEMKGVLEGHPTSYPSLVHFSTGYRGYTYPIAKCVPLPALYAALEIADPKPS